MNRDQFKKCVGQTLRLQPHAIGAQGESRDDDWTAELNADEDEVVLKHMGGSESVVVGLDHVHSYMSDRAKGKTHGFLQMLSQVRIAPDGTISAVPLPPRQAGIARPTFNPLVVNDGTADRYLTWSARDPEHLIAHEGQARQLSGTYTAICDALRTATGREPQFDRPNDIRHEIVWELTADHESKHKLLGGMDTKAGTAVLVLTGQASEAYSATETHREFTPAGDPDRALLRGGSNPVKSRTPAVTPCSRLTDRSCRSALVTSSATLRRTGCGGVTLTTTKSSTGTTSPFPQAVASSWCWLDGRAAETWASPRS